MNLSLWLPFAILGAVIGSFLNVVADRLPARESLVRPPSQCPSCHRRLRALELIPVMSFLALRGRCRTCRARIPRRVFAVELGTAVVFGLAAWRYGVNPRAVISSVYAALLIAFLVIDMEHGLIPNRLIVPALGVAALAVPFSGWVDPVYTLLGGAVSFGLLLAIAVVASGGMGMGDVKLGAFLGVILGFPQIVPGLLVAFISGGAIAAGLLISGRLKRDDRIPFGPFMAAAGILFLLYGDPIEYWWLARFPVWT